MRFPWSKEAEAPPPVEPVAIPSLGNGVTVPITESTCSELLESMRADTLPDAGEEFLVDWAGVRTRIGMLPWAPQELRGVTSTRLPIPDDGYRSEAAEYAALGHALSTARGTFRIVEVGAGWAPWVVCALVVARRRGLTGYGIAVEADERRSQWAVQHAIDNDLGVELVQGTPDEIADALAEPHDGIDMRVVRAAGWHTRTVLEFPDLDEEDMGAAIWTLPGTDIDYRGAHLTHHEVPAVSLEDLLLSDTVTDLLHIDVQGVEFELLEPASHVVQDHTRILSIGTTDRLSEGRLQQHWLSRGWGLLVDEPCVSVFTMTHPTLAGFTVRDGNQVYENPFLRS